jgi:hypothetical protein
MPSLVMPTAPVTLALPVIAAPLSSRNKGINRGVLFS